MTASCAVCLGFVLCVLATGCGGSSDGNAGEVVGDAVAGREVWTKGACEGCHAFREFRQGNVGPDLGVALQGKDADFIRESIVKPAARIAPGFSALMPTDYGAQFSGRELDDLVAFLQTG